MFWNADTRSLHRWNFEHAHTPICKCSGLLIITLCILAVVHTTDMLSQRHQKHCHHCNNFYCACSFVILKRKKKKKKSCAIFVDAHHISTQCFFAKSGFCSLLPLLPRLISPIEAEGGNVIFALPRFDVWEHLLSVRAFGLGAWTAYLESSRILFRFWGSVFVQWHVSWSHLVTRCFCRGSIASLPRKFSNLPSFFCFCVLDSFVAKRCYLVRKQLERIKKRQVDSFQPSYKLGTRRFHNLINWHNHRWLCRIGFVAVI